MIFPWSKSPEERMISEVRAEVDDYLRRCEALHEEFRQRLSVRDGVRDELSEAEENIKTLQIKGVALLGEFSAAISSGDDEKLRETESIYKRHYRELGKAEQHREVLTAKLEEIGLEDKESARELKASASELLDEYSRDIKERKQWLTGVMEALDDQREELGRKAAPLLEEYESRKSPEELPAAEEPPE